MGLLEPHWTVRRIAPRTHEVIDGLAKIALGQIAAELVARDRLQNEPGMSVRCHSTGSSCRQILSVA